MRFRWADPSKIIDRNSTKGFGRFIRVRLGGHMVPSGSTLSVHLQSGELQLLQMRMPDCQAKRDLDRFLERHKPIASFEQDRHGTPCKVLIFRGELEVWFDVVDPKYHGTAQTIGLIADPVPGSMKMAGA